MKKTFKLLKYIKCDNENQVKSITRCLDVLKDTTFENINIPDFSYKISGNTIIQDIEFIKGQELCLHNYKDYSDIIFNDFVLRENEYSVIDYACGNFILEEHTKKLWYVDLEAFERCTLQKRKEAFFLRLKRYK